MVRSWAGPAAGVSAGLCPGCSSNGEFSDRGYGKGGVVAIAIGHEVVGRCAAALADVSQDIDAGIEAAASRLSSQLGCSLRSLDEQHWAGLALLEGARGREERINVAFGDIAPFMPFVGGSAGTTSPSRAPGPSPMGCWPPMARHCSCARCCGRSATSRRATSRPPIPWSPARASIPTSA